MLVRMEATFSDNPEEKKYGYWMLAKTAEAGIVTSLQSKKKRILSI